MLDRRIQGWLANPFGTRRMTHRARIRSAALVLATSEDCLVFLIHSGVSGAKEGEMSLRSRRRSANKLQHQQSYIWQLLSGQRNKERAWTEVETTDWRPQDWMLVLVLQNKLIDEGSSVHNSGTVSPDGQFRNLCVEGKCAKTFRIWTLLASWVFSIIQRLGVRYKVQSLEESK